jgi:hypothetical protein
MKVAALCQLGMTADQYKTARHDMSLDGAAAEHLSLAEKEWDTVGEPVGYERDPVLVSAVSRQSRPVVRCVFVVPDTNWRAHRGQER